MQEEQHSQRRALVRMAIWITMNTPLAPSLYERQLLAQYVRGVLTIEQVVALSAEAEPGWAEQ